MAAAGVLTVNPHLNRAAMPFDPINDLAPVTMLAEIPFVLVSSQQSGIVSVADLIARARAQPQGLSIGHGGNGTAMHLTSALFNQKAGVGIQLIAYRGTAPASTDVLAGHVPLAVLDIPASKPLISDGKLKALGLRRKTRRLPARRASSGGAGPERIELVGWFGIVAPAGTPPDVIAALNAAFVKALSDPAAIEKFAFSAPNPHLRHPRLLRNSSRAKARNGAS